MADHYEALGIKRTATDDEVKKAFKRLAIKYHPDKSSDPKHHQLFIRINEAYEVLKDPATRRQYNREIGASVRANGPAPAARPLPPASTFSRSFATASFFDLYQRYKNYGANFSRDDAALRARQQQAEAERQRQDHEERLRRQQHERAQAELDQRLQREAEIRRMKHEQEAFMRAKQQEQRERERERERLYEEQKRRAYRALMGSSQDPIVLSDSDVEVTAERGARPRLPRQSQQPLPPPQQPPPQQPPPQLPPPDMFNIRPRPPRGASPRRVPRPATESNVREPPGKRFKPNPLLDLETLVDSLHAADEGTSMSDLLDSLPAVRRELMNRAAQGTPLKRARYDYIGGTPRADTLHRPVNTGAKAHSTMTLTMAELGADPHVAALAPPPPPQLAGLPPAACWDLARAYQHQFAHYRTRVLQHQLHRARCDEALAAAIVANAATWAIYTRCLQQDAAVARRFAALLQTYTETMAKVGRE